MVRAHVTDNGHSQLSVQGSKYLWILPSASDKSVLDLAARYNLSTPIMQTLVGRGISSTEHIDSFLFTGHEHVAHASILMDAQKGVDRICAAIDKGERILVFGDYDVDGMTATALMVYCLLSVSAKVNFHLPNRMTEGYGLSVDAVKKAARNGYSLIITVDNGVTAFQPAHVAQQLGIDLIITDHHHPAKELPEAYALINPLRTDCAYPCKQLAGVGVAFKLMALLFEQLKRPLPEKVYELLALGTIADVVPLVEENRFWVRYGLAQINRATSLPIKILKQNSNITKEYVASTDIGFSLAPQINALGRLSDPRKAIAFLIGSDAQLVTEVGQLLHELNETRKMAERSIMLEIEAALLEKRIDLDHENIIMAAHNAWPIGVIGLVASRLVSMYGKPTLLFHYGSDGHARGSGRSISAFNLFDALQSNSDLLDHFGGHAAAAGLSLPIEHVPQLKERLEQQIVTQLTPYELQQKLILDAQVQLYEVTHKFMEDLAHLEPFGHENEPPLFYIKKVMQVQKPMLLKDQHVKAHVFSDGIIKPIIFFNRPELYHMLLELNDEPFDCACYVVENHWNGRVNIELQGIDIATGL